MKDRIRQIMEQTQLTQQDFSARLGISPASLSGIFNGRTNPTNNHVQAIHRAFPEVNVNWLLFGEGDMIDAAAGGADGDAADGEGTEGAELAGMGSLFAAGAAATAASGSNAEGRYPDLFAAGSVAQHSAAPAHSAVKSAANGREARLAGIYPAMQPDYVKNIDKPMRKIREIRVFFDDGTYESFVPSSK